MTAVDRNSSGDGVTSGRGIAFGPDELTENEIAWVEFLRMIGNGRELRPTLRRVQLIRRVCGMK